MGRRGRARWQALGYLVLVLALVAWVLFAVLVLQPWWIREVGGW